MARTNLTGHTHTNALSTQHTTIKLSTICFRAMHTMYLVYRARHFLTLVYAIVQAPERV